MLAIRLITTPSAVATVAKRRTPTSTPTGEPGCATLGCWGRWTSTRTLASNRVPLRRTEIASTRARPRSAGRNEAFDATGVLVCADSADHRQCKVTPVGFDPQSAGGETHPVSVAAFAFEAREPDSFASAFAGAGLLPVRVGVDRTCDAVGVGLFRAFGPPHCTGLRVDADAVFDGVPAFP